MTDDESLDYPIFYKQGGPNSLQGINNADTICIGFDYGCLFPNLDSVGKGKYFIKTRNFSHTSGNKLKNLTLVDYRWNEIFELPFDSTEYTIDDEMKIISLKYELLPFSQPIASSIVYNRDLVARRTVNISDYTTVTMNKPTVVNMYGTDLFDSEIIVDEDATLRLTDSVRIIAKRGDCRIIVRGSMTLGDGVVFEACDGATLELIFENNADLSVSNATFINCDLILPGKNLSFSNCHFIGTPFLADLSMYKPQNNTATLMNCDFVPNGKTIPEAIYIKHYPHYLVHGCSIDATGVGSFVSGIAIFNSGNNMGSQNISNNSVKGCMSGGVLMYASYGDITENVIEGNGQGVKLYNNCNIGQFMGNCQATTGTETQYIHDNGTYEVFMTANCVPETFMYNYISDDDNVPFVYHDITAYYVDPGITPRSDIDVSMNYWGSNFTPSTHLYTNQNLTGFVYLPYWVMGNCATIENTNASAMVSEADSLNAIGEYASAKSLYLQVVDDYPNTISAETALKTLLVLEEHTGNDYNALKAYYQTNSAIASDENLNHLASSLANKCNERMENYNEAIAWYEEVLTNPNTSFNDSIFAAIDLGDLYLKMDAGGEKGIGKLGQYRPESAIEHERQTEYALSLLPRRPIANKDCAENDPKLDISVPVSISISPNPTNDLVRIEGATVAEVQVYNTLGQLVKTIRNSNEVNLKDLPQGIYTVHVTNEEGNSVIRKVLKE